MPELPAELPAGPWVHIGDCPLCGDGLCRVRCCTTENGQKRLFAICDECEAIWLQPNTSSKYLTPDPEEPLCPFSQQPLYGPSSRWATTEDVLGTEWESQTIIDLPVSLIEGSNELLTTTDEAAFVTDEDIASALDVPTLSPPARTVDNATAEPHSDDWAYGQDEPRPGC